MTLTQLIRRLADHGAPAVDASRESICAAILDADLEQVIAGRGPDRRPLTYRQAFEHLFGEPLERASIGEAA